MTLHLNLPGSHHRSAAQQEELREARRQLKEKIRNDWDYPPLPAHRSSGRHPPGTVSDPTAVATTTDIEDRIAGFRFHTPPSASVPGENGRPAEGSLAHVLGLDFEPTEWRAREDGSEDDDEDSSSADTRTGGTVHKGKKSGESIRFDRPDSVAVELEERRQARKRRRLGMLEEEVQWNDGLAHWLRRRDVWCCARGAEEVRSVEEAQSHAGAQHSRTTTSSSSSAAASMTSASSARSSTSSASPQSNAASLNTPITTPSTSPPIPDSTVDSSSHPTNQPSTLPPSLQPILLPIAPPLLPTHPIRTRITPAQHPEIYSKIILQSRTPSVPINLQTLIRALVQGWISDGEWPPKPGVVERSFARRKLKDGEGVGSVVKGGIRKVLRLTGVGGGGGVDVVK